MSWLDLLMLFTAFFLIYVGTRRGFIAELFDLLLLVAAFTVGIFLKGYLAQVFINNFKWSAGHAHWVSFMLIFLPSGTGVFLLGCYVKDAVHENYKLSPETDQVLGGFLAALKSLVIVTLILLLVGAIPGTSRNFRATMGKGLLVRQVDRLVPLIKKGVPLLSPPKEGKYLVTRIQKARFPTPENKLKNLGK